jgi:hypothetical protein
MTNHSNPVEHASDTAPAVSGVEYRVGLSSLQDLGLIVKSRTGVVYTNECAGYAGAHHEAEGFFVPLRAYGEWRELCALQNAFDAYGEALKAGEADRFDEVIRRLGLDSVRADRSKVEQSVEGWVHVIASVEHDFTPRLVSRAKDSFEAVLVWPNRG